MIIGMYFDYVGYLDKEPEEEYEEAEEMFRELLPDYKITFKRDLLPHKALAEKVDIYLLDNGGLTCSYGAGHNLANDQVKNTIKLAEEKPNTLIIIWSGFTARWYAEIIKEDNPELTNQPNVFLRYKRPFDYEEANLQEKLKEWGY